MLNVLADADHRLPAKMAFKTLDPIEFLEDGFFSEDIFLEKADKFNWDKFSGKKVLVRGCSLVVPPWVYMYITSKLIPMAHSIRYGNEHDNMVVFRKKTKS